MKISQNDREALHAVKQQMELNPGMPFNLQTIAEAAGMGRSKFQKTFTLLFKEHPYALLRELRLQSAYELLEQQMWSVKEVGFKVGYKSLASFSVAFKKRFGVCASKVG